MVEVLKTTLFWGDYAGARPSGNEIVVQAGETFLFSDLINDYIAAEANLFGFADGTLGYLPFGDPTAINTVIGSLPIPSYFLDEDAYSEAELETFQDYGIIGFAGGQTIPLENTNSGLAGVPLSDFSSLRFNISEEEYRTYIGAKSSAIFSGSVNETHLNYYRRDFDGNFNFFPDAYKNNTIAFPLTDDTGQWVSSHFSITVEGPSPFTEDSDDVDFLNDINVDAGHLSSHNEALAGDDVVALPNSSDSFFGGSGNDLIEGNGGNDTISGDEDDDLIVGGDGNDTLIGGQGSDILNGDAGNDVLVGGFDNVLGFYEEDEAVDYLAGHDGIDQFVAGVGDVVDELEVGETVELLETANVATHYYAYEGNDGKLYLGAFNDSILPSVVAEITNGFSASEISVNATSGQNAEFVRNSAPTNAYEYAQDDVINNAVDDLKSRVDSFTAKSGVSDVKGALASTTAGEIAKYLGKQILKSGALAKYVPFIGNILGIQQLAQTIVLDLYYDFYSGDTAARTAAYTSAFVSVFGGPIGAISFQIGSFFFSEFVREFGSLSIQYLEDFEIEHDPIDPSIVKLNGSDGFVVFEAAQSIFTEDNEPVAHSAASEFTARAAGASENDPIYLFTNDESKTFELAESATVYAAAGDDQIIGTEEGDTIYSDKGSDNVEGSLGNDVLHSTYGEGNILNGGDGSDALTSFAGSSQLIGGTGGDVLTGGIGDDLLVGGEGSDVLRGDVLNTYGGNDRLVAGSGEDLLEGGIGADTFVFRPNEGNNTIANVAAFRTGFDASVAADFSVFVDQIELSGFDIDSKADALALVASDTDGHAVFSSQGTSVTLIGIDEDLLTSDVFVLV